MSEEEFRTDKFIRTELEIAINGRAFQEAVKILTRRRQNNEARAESQLGMDAIASVRLQNQRIGAEGFINDLHDLCEPIKLTLQQEKADFGQPEALKQLEAYLEKEE